MWKIDVKITLPDGSSQETNFEYSELNDETTAEAGSDIESWLDNEVRADLDDEDDDEDEDELDEDGDGVEDEDLDGTSDESGDIPDTGEDKD